MLSWKIHALLHLKSKCIFEPLFSCKIHLFLTNLPLVRDVIIFENYVPYHTKSYVSRL